VTLFRFLALGDRLIWPIQGSYAYDRFGRMTEDGGLTYAYDENDNRTEVGYRHSRTPGGYR